MIFGRERIVELTVTADYLNWTPEESIRDLIQNGIDAGAKGTPFSWSHEGETLTLTNDGATIPWKAMLIGYSTKRDDATQIGQYGEGLKLSCLCLTRSGFPIRIENGDEVWEPLIEQSETFNEPVLKFKVHNVRNAVTGVSIHVGGVTQELWDKCKDLFLRLEGKPVNVPYEKGGIEVLSGAERRGFVYVGGIQVARMSDPAIHFGYNFPPKTLPVDRDRRMVGMNDLISRTTSLWVSLASEAEEALAEFIGLLKADAPDIREVRWAWNVAGPLADKVAEDFRRTYGNAAYPVKATEGEEAKILQNTAAADPICVADAYVHVLRKSMGEISTLIDKAKTETFAPVAPFDLTSAERDCFHTCWIMALDALNDPEFKPKVRAEVVLFASEGLAGTFKEIESGSYVVRIDRRMLVSPGETMATMIHELSHRKGYHQDADFLLSMEKTWATCFSVMWETLAKR